MKILMTTDTVGGVWSYAVELARALEGGGARIALATMGGPLSPGQRDSVGRLRQTRIYESNYNLEWMDDPWDDVREAGNWLLDIQRRFRPDLIHLNSYVHGDLPWNAPVLMVGHSCVLSWWEAVRQEMAPAEWDRYRELVGKGLRRADLVCAPTAVMMDSLRRHYGPLPRTRVIHNARDGGTFKPQGKARMIFASGRLWDEAKNLRQLESVAHKLSWPVYLAGNNQAPGGGLLQFGNMNYLGLLNEDEMASWFGRAAIYVHPARYEPFGLAVLEAALSRCALVLGDIPTLRELWQDRAIFVPPDDSAALAEAVEMLVEDSELRHFMAGAAFERAAHFSPERMAAEYLEAYGRLMTQAAPAKAPAPLLPRMPQLQPGT